ncbi:MAG: N-(5'-phosphoribosyl)anthranilate isomerase, partial [Microcystaceae cyanobacterium]
MRIKICGITQVEQGKAIASLGATALGFICVPTSPRFIPATHIKTITQEIPSSIDLIGVFADASFSTIIDTVTTAGLTGIQLHGKESPQFCQDIRENLPNVELIKAFRVKDSQTLQQIPLYTPYIDTLLLDAYHPQQLGGTGKTIESRLLKDFK